MELKMLLFAVIHFEPCIFPGLPGALCGGAAAYSPTVGFKLDLMAAPNFCANTKALPHYVLVVSLI